MKTFLHGPMAYAIGRFCVEDLDMPERRKAYASCRVEEENKARRCPCDDVEDNITHSGRIRTVQRGTGCGGGNYENRRM